MDDLDHRLIAALRVDGRAPLSELAKSLGVSRGTIQNRLDRLIASDVILGFTVRVKGGPAANQIRAIMMIEVAGKNTRQVAKSLRGMPQIHALHSTNGAFDLIAEIEVAESRGVRSRALDRQIDRRNRKKRNQPAAGAGLSLFRAARRIGGHGSGLFTFRRRSASRAWIFAASTWPSFVSSMASAR